jgi:hypothetical protein
MHVFSFFISKHEYLFIQLEQKTSSGEILLYKILFIIIIVAIESNRIESNRIESNRINWDAAAVLYNEKETNGHYKANFSIIFIITL